MKLWSVVTTLFAFAAMSLATPAMAQDAGAAVKERVAIMKNVSGAMKALAKSAEAGKVGGKDAERAAKPLAGAKKVASQFPANSGSDMVKTRAKPEIWTDAAGFEAAGGVWYKAYQTIKATTDEASFKAAFPALGESCKGCHEKFRRPKG